MILSKKFPGSACQVVLVLILMSGCGGDPFERSKMTGTVTFEGKPVPFGEVLFSPDSKRGNSGPSVVAPIAPDGTYQTQDQKGAIPGPTIATITGFAGTPDSVKGGGGPRILVDNHVVEIDVPKKSGVFDFHLTKDQIRNP